MQLVAGVIKHAAGCGRDQTVVDYSTKHAAGCGRDQTVVDYSTKHAAGCGRDQTCSWLWA